MSHEQLSIRTRDGDCPAHIFKPEGLGPWPAAIFYMDGLGIRPTLFEMASGSRMAATSCCCPIFSIVPVPTSRCSLRADPRSCESRSRC
jgi:hypothetical protein